MTFKVKDGISIAGNGFVDGSRNVTANNTTLTGELRGPATFVIDPAAVGDNTGTVVIKGDLQIEGTTTTVNSTTLTVDDKNIELGSVASPTDTTADGGGITLRGATNKTFTWVDATDAWTSSEHLAIAAGKDLIINGQSSGVINLKAPVLAGTQSIYLPPASGTIALTSDIKDPSISISAGSGLTGGGSFTLNQSSTATVTLSHADTSSAANLTATSRTYVTGLTFDTYGHVTGYTTGTETVTDTNTTYDHLAVTTTGGALLRLHASSGTNDDVKLASGTNVTVAYTDDNTITISSTDTNTVTRLRGTASGTYTSGDLTLLAGSNVTITQSGSDYTIAATQPSVGAGTLGVSIGAAGATNTTVTWGTSTGFNANTASNYTYDLKVGPALTNLATLMTTAGAGFIKRGATADTYTIDTNTYLTSYTETDTLATVTSRGNVSTGHINVPSGEGTGFCFWNDSTNYKIHMGVTAGTYQYGPVTDYSMRFTMGAGTGRGFTWGYAGSAPIAALNAYNGNMQIAGSFYAASKSFLIPHPTKEGKKLCHGSLEGPENGVYVRGKLTANNVIELPEYWTKLVDPDSITVQLTPIGKHQNLFVEEIADNKVIVGNSNVFGKEINCFFVVYAERVDIAKLEVESE